MRRSQIALLTLAAALPLAACSGNKHTTSTASTPTRVSTVAGKTTVSSTASSEYRVTIDPAQFTTEITNPYLPLKPGTTAVYDGTRDGQPQHTERLVTNQTKVIMGVTCVVVRDTVTSNGALIEATSAWYAQAHNGAVWYFGEGTKEYTNGVVSSTHGLWEARRSPFVGPTSRSSPPGGPARSGRPAAARAPSCTCSPA